VIVWRTPRIIAFRAILRRPPTLSIGSGRIESLRTWRRCTTGRPSLTEGSAAEQEFGRAVHAQLLFVMGVQPVAGRAFTEGRGSPTDARGCDFYPLCSGGSAATRVLWDAPILMNNEKTTVPRRDATRLQFPLEDTDFWAPANSRRRSWPAGQFILSVVARLKPRVSVRQAQARWLQSPAVGTRTSGESEDGRGRGP